MYLGDNLLRDGITDLVDAFRAHEPDALILLTQVPDPWHYGVAELDGERVVRLVEKPKDPPSDLALVGVYMFGPAIFEAARAIEPSGRGELEITDAIQHLIDGGTQVESRTVERLVEGHRPARRHARGEPPRARGHRAPASTASWSTPRSRAGSSIEAGARLERSVVRGPAIIGAGARITRLLHRPLHVDRPRASTIDALRGRALDPARGLPASRDLDVAHGGEPARAATSKLARGDGLPEDPADDRRRQLGDHDPVRVAGHRRRRDARARRRRRRCARARPRGRRRSPAPSSTSPTPPPCEEA